MQLKQADTGDLKEVYALMVKNFIPDEVRDFADIKRLHGKGKFTVYNIEENDERLGFMTVWDLGGFAFLEHFVIREAYRGNGIGGKALTLLQKKYGNLVLETELPLDSLQKRRVNFYARHGMCLNPQDYRQPPYRENGKACDMKIMSFPHALSDFAGTVEKIYREVYGKA